MTRILRALERAYPEVVCDLDFVDPWQCLASTILSAQCTDTLVNTVTPLLFERYPTPVKAASARVSPVQKIIKSLGLYRAKAKNIIASAKMIVTEFDGKVPDTLEALVTLPGVGRKTANCVLVNAFGKPGIMCDTHCCRVSRRLGLHQLTDPVKIEFVLGGLMAPRHWGDFSHRIIIHGRHVCKARKPDCDNCSLRKHCSFGLARDLG